MEIKNNDIKVHPTTEETEKAVWAILETVPDPEVPVLSVVDLGVVRKVEITPATTSSKGSLLISYTPTYTGCPAMDVMKMTMQMA